jgi:hypothetical protein
MAVSFIGGGNVSTNVEKCFHEKSMQNCILQVSRHILLHSLSSIIAVFSSYYIERQWTEETNTKLCGGGIYKKLQWLHAREHCDGRHIHMCSPNIWVCHVAHLVTLMCCVVFLCFVCLRPVSCVPMLPVSLDCPFVIASSVFSNVYI